MRNIKDLTNEEVNRLAMDLSEIQCDATERIVNFADKYGISRDEAMKHFITGMAIVTKTMSLENYETSEGVKHANRG